MSAVQRAVFFLRYVGFQVNRVDSLEGYPAVLDDVCIMNGQLFYTREVYPGYLLHEAGHLAVIASAVRHEITGNVTKCFDENPRVAAFYRKVYEGAEGMTPHLCYTSDAEATGWSYYAALAAGFNGPLFEQGYGETIGEELSETIRSGIATGTGSLYTVGLYYAGFLANKASNKMLKWLQD